LLHGFEECELLVGSKLFDILCTRLK
jgi:hypothetical protein